MRSIRLVILAVVGCAAGSGETDPPAADGSSPGDAGPTDAQAAGAPDSGTIADSGPPGDTGAEPDAATTDAASPACAVSGMERTCSDVTDCDGVAFFFRCDGPPRSVCCFDPADACSVSGAPGLCLATAECTGDYAPTPGLCPGPAGIQCCTNPAEACDPAASPSPNEGLVETIADATCPPGMVRVDTFCVDQFEASLLVIDAAGQPIGHWSPFVSPAGARTRAVSIAYAVPQGYISGVEAAAACAEAGKRLCTDDEWLRACRGPSALTYPYGDVREDGRCNDARSRHPAIEYFGTSDPWIFGELDHRCINQIPRSITLTGQKDTCETAEHAFDMMGNLHEWTADPNGTFRGGFYADTRINGDGCLYRTVAHDVSHWDYSTGFRCCADPT
jgi:hypothetical protein